MEPSSNFLQDLIRRWIDGGIDNQARLLYSILTTFAVLLLTWWYIRVYRRRLPLPPGPFGIPLLGSLPFLDPELHTYFAELGRKYGPIVKLQLGSKIGILINSPSVAREVLKDNDITFANRDPPSAAKAASYGGNDIAWTPYGPEWRLLRKICVVKMLSNATLDSVYTFRRREVRNTVAYIYSRVGSPINIGEQSFLTTLNVITNMLWGGTVEGEERERLGAEFRDVVSEITAQFLKPDISDFFPKLARFDLQGIGKQTFNLAKKFDNMFDKMIGKRLSISKEGDGGKNAANKDFLEYLLKLKDEDSKTPLTMTQLKALLMDMVVGGTETSSNAIEFVMAEMLKNPKLMIKAQEELAMVVGKDNIVEESHIHSLPYLQAVMKETLRLHPMLPLLIPHCPSETTTISNYRIPKGSRVFINVWAIQRDPNYWENPLEFNPERFLNSKWDYSGSDFCYFPFGSGRRICAGIAMAERMFLYSLATLLHSFDWKLQEGEELEISEKFGIVLKKKTPLVAIPMPRLTDPALYE